MTALVALVALLPLAGGAAALAGARARVASWVSVLGALGALGVAVALAVRVVTGVPARGLGGYLYVDPLAGFFLVTVALVVVLAALPATRWSSWSPGSR